MDYIFARSATKHRISRRSSLEVILNADGWIDAVPSAGHRYTSSRRLYVGRDALGQLLEVVAVELDDGGLLVIHAMHARPKTLMHWRESQR